MWSAVGIGLGRTQWLETARLFWLDQLFAARQGTRWAPRVHPDVLIVGIDDRTRKTLRGRALAGGVEDRGLTREAIARLLVVVAKAGAKAVGVDYYFDVPLSANVDAALEQALAGNETAGTRGVDAVLGCMINVREQKRPLERFRQWADEGNLMIQPDDDGKFRRLRPGIVVDNGRIPIFSFQICRVFVGKPNDSGSAIDTPWTWHADTDGSVEAGGVHAPAEMLIDYAGPAQTWAMHGQEFSAIDVLDGKVPGETFAGKVVLIGPTLRSEDRFTVSIAPSSGDKAYREFLTKHYDVNIGEQSGVKVLHSGAMSGIEIHANAVAQMLEGRYLREARIDAPWLMPALTAVLVLGLGWAFYQDPRSGRLRRWIIAGVILFVVLFVGAIAAAGGLFFVGRWVFIPLEFLAAWTAQAVCGMLFTATALHYQNRRIEQMFGNAVGEELLEYIHAHPEILTQSTRRTATVLFCDIRGFTSLTESLESHELVALLEEHFEALWAPLAEQGAWVDKYVGDLVMAAWNVLKPAEDQALRAVRAAVEMKIARHRLNQARAEQALPLVEIGIGIHTGEVVGGNVGSRKRSNFTLIGDAVNLASRIENEARHGEILISQSTYELVKDRIVSRELPAVELRGKTGLYILHEVMAIKDGPSVPRTLSPSHPGEGMGG